MSKPYALLYTDRAVADFECLRVYDQRRVVDAIETHLTHEPMRVSRSRIKRMDQPFWSQYRLRVEDFRVYYDVAEELQSVTILRILEKGTAQTPEHPS